MLHEECGQRSRVVTREEYFKRTPARVITTLFIEQEYRCQNCGGYSNDGEEWHWVCDSCGTEVDYGELVSDPLFPHHCRACAESISATAESNYGACPICGHAKTQCKC